MGFFLSPAPETSLHVLSNLQKLKSALGLPLLVSVSRKSFLGATVGLPVKDLVQRALRRNFTRSAMALTTSAPTRPRSAKRNHLLGNPREISQSRRQRPRVESCLAFTFRPPASGPRSGSAKVGADMLACQIKLHYEAAVHTAPWERMDSEEPPNVRVACSGDIDEVVRLMHDAAAWMSAKGTPARDVARIDRTFAETFVLRSELLGSPQKTESMVTPVFATPILTTSWLA